MAADGCWARKALTVRLKHFELQCKMQKGLENSEWCLIKSLSSSQDLKTTEPASTQSIPDGKIWKVLKDAFHLTKLQLTDFWLRCWRGYWWIWWRPRRWRWSWRVACGTFVLRSFQFLLHHTLTFDDMTDDGQYWLGYVCTIPFGKSASPQQHHCLECSLQRHKKVTKLKMLPTPGS